MNMPTYNIPIPTMDVPFAYCWFGTRMHFVILRPAATR